jgi:hypothetical protein
VSSLVVPDYALSAAWARSCISRLRRSARPDAAAQLLPALGEYASADADKRKLEHDALVRQLRVTAGALANTSARGA